MLLKFFKRPAIQMYVSFETFQHPSWNEVLCWNIWFHYVCTEIGKLFLFHNPTMLILLCHQHFHEKNRVYQITQPLVPIPVLQTFWVTGLCWLLGHSSSSWAAPSCPEPCLFTMSTTTPGVRLSGHVYISPYVTIAMCYVAVWCTIAT